MATYSGMVRCKWRGHDWALETWSLIPLEPRGELAGCDTECPRCESSKYEEFVVTKDRFLGEKFGRTKYRPSKAYRELAVTREDARASSFARSGARRRLRAVS